VSVVATNAGAKRSASSSVSAVSDPGDDDFGGWYVDGQPVVGADGQPVTTWQEDYPYDQRMSTKRSLQLSCSSCRAGSKTAGRRWCCLSSSESVAGDGGEHVGVLGGDDDVDLLTFHWGSAAVDADDDVES